MDKYLKMADMFHGECADEILSVVYDGSLSESGAKYAAHAINSHDELVEEVDRLRESLKWAVGNLPFENAFEWSDDENADAHYAALRLLGVQVDE